VLVRRHGDFDNAEDAVQDALLAAAVSWPGEGVPESPRGWLLQTAERRLIDRWRSERSRRERESRALAEPEAAEAVDADDTLLVLLMCCHPALTPASAIALTLRAAGGLTTAEIASAFLVDETTMAQRISRAKRRVEDSGVPFRLPATGELDERLRTVLHVLYLVFNEGYATSSGAQLQRTELSGEAIRLAQLVHRLVPDDPEAAGLLALMLLVDARRPARTDANGEPVPLPDQDRALWDHGRIAEGIAVLDGAAGKGRVGEYRLQAAIAALHDRAPTAADTDWPQILALYGLLEQVSGSPVVTLNKAVAAAMAHSPEAGLAVLDAIDEQLAGSHRLDAVRAHLLEQAGDADGALRHYRAAARRTTNLPERRYLIRRAARLRALSDPARGGARPAASASPPAPPRTRPASRGAP
jgi:RNA polymerase sigma factor (sigma-70 family)